ncbi:fungal-specific transcription factor domain-containing protein [Rhypophila decipiens]|uniref:Fungal-specific transcription factor domain-containing protein n=1 Tax=Rhypophila decipiens TaxID=261697 RepID=A0AAN6YJA5_9PEZI|nr:fungal-specific transcription factor domain-containing protein [Rhypophila decipiens]
MDHEEAESSAEKPSIAPTVPRACDACRARKIRCNRETPCAHCVQAKIECSHDGARPKEKRARVLVSSQYEKKIDQIDSRLDVVVRLLQDVRSRLPPPGSSPQPQASIPGQTQPSAPITTQIHNSASSSATATPGTSTGSHVDAAMGPMVEGNSSLTAHSIFAKDLLQKIIDEGSRPEMRETLDALHAVVEAMKKQPAAKEMTYPNARPDRSVPAFLQGCELPPIQRSLHVVKLARSHQLPSISWVYEFIPVHHFPETCLSIYLSENYNEADFIMVNACLHYLFETYSYQLEGDEQAEYRRLSKLCGANLETALSNLPLHLPANVDTIAALLLGAYYAIDLSQPQLSWILSSKASELCQTLGYHRLATYQQPTRPPLHPSQPMTPLESQISIQQKQSLFWAVYIADKGLALRLGRASTIQDYDVTVPYPASEGRSSNPIAMFLRGWVLVANVQGRIYEQLYCPEAIRLAEGERWERAKELVGMLSEVERFMGEATERWRLDGDDAVGKDLAEFIVGSDAVLRLSLLTLVYRAVPHPPGSRTTFRPECVRAARATLERHQQCMAVVAQSEFGLFSIYMHWTILFAPFVPFIVLFCQVIETKDRDDLSRLQAFVVSIQSSNSREGGVSEAVDRLCRLFQVLYSVASHYVESYAAGGGGVYPTGTGGVGDSDMFQGASTQGIGAALAGVDTYLAALGFPPPQLNNASANAEVQGQAGFGGGGSTDLPYHSGHDGRSQEQFAIKSGDDDFQLDGVAGEGQEPQRALDPMIWMGNEAQLEGWLYSNQQVLSFLEDGLLDTLGGMASGSGGNGGQ